jgi:hypothetical protein
MPGYINVDFAMLIRYENSGVALMGMVLPQVRTVQQNH